MRSVLTEIKSKEVLIKIIRSTLCRFYKGKFLAWTGDNAQKLLIFEETFQMLSYAEHFHGFLFSKSAQVYNTGLQLQMHAGNICVCKGFRYSRHVHTSKSKEPKDTHDTIIIIKRQRRLFLADNVKLNITLTFLVCVQICIF